MRNLENIIHEIKILLQRNPTPIWTDCFSKLHEEVLWYKEMYDIDFIIKIRNLYGGMGSFNDLVLSKNYIPLIEENNKLEKLKAELYEKYIELRTKIK